ncbi:Alpha/Beta hydrolase protein [Syncephalis fuscata]|nr:Alpha/Beta hydrolase protein [Syncephalis fuscata]
MGIIYLLTGLLAMVVAIAICLALRAPALSGKLVDLRTVYRNASPEERALMPYPEDFYSGGAYVTLEHGDVRYYLLGPEDGRKIVLVHGLQWPCTVWEFAVKDLVMRGYRVLTYDNYGRGYSDGPAVVNDELLYTHQLYQLLEHLGWTHTLLIGYSMGGAIATAFTQSYPNLVERLVLIAPGGLIGAKFDGINTDSTSSKNATKQNNVPAIARIAKHPLLLSVLMGAMSMKWLNKKAAPSPDDTSSIINYQMVHCPATVRAIALSLRDFPFFSQNAAYQALGRLTNIPVLVFWGTKDTIVPYTGAPVLSAYVPHAQLVTIDDGTHLITRSHHDFIITSLDSFFQ